MVEDLRLPAVRRDQSGSADTRRLRRSGRVPMIVYGLGRASESVSADKEVIDKLVSTRSSVVDLELDGSVSKAVVQDLQWDVFSMHVQHIDLRLVDPDGRVSVDVPVETRGEPAAVKEGAILKQHMKTVRINCPDYRIPKSLPARVGAMQVGNTVKASELTIPETAVLETDGNEVVVELFDPRKAGSDEQEG